MQYLIWDFDGTLGYRSGMWSGTLVEVLRQEMPECPATVEDMRPYLQAGFPWHHSEQPHTPHKTAEAWWAALLPVFERAFQYGARLGTHPGSLAAASPERLPRCCLPRRGSGSAPSHPINCGALSPMHWGSGLRAPGLCFAGCVTAPDARLGT